MQPGQMNKHAVWLFMLGGVVLAGALSAMGVGKIGFAIFAAAAFGSTFMTQAGKGLAFGSWFVGAILLAIATVIGGAMAGADAATTSQVVQEGGNIQIAEGAGATVGAAIGVFASIFVFIGALVSSTVGLFAGSAAKNKMGPAAA